MPIGLADTGRVSEGPDRERKRRSAVVRNGSSALFSELMFANFSLRLSGFFKSTFSVCTTCCSTACSLTGFDFTCSVDVIASYCRFVIPEGGWWVLSLSFDRSRQLLATRAE